MPLLASLRTGLAALCRKFIICIRLPDYAYYINGPETLPPPLSKEEEKVVFAGLEAGNPDCRDVLIVHNLRLVVYIAKKFESKTASVEDMISIGTIGLIKAVNTFRADKGIRLATYASRCIENEILSQRNKRRLRWKSHEPFWAKWSMYYFCAFRCFTAASTSSSFCSVEQGSFRTVFST